LGDRRNVIFLTFRFVLGPQPWLLTSSTAGESALAVFVKSRDWGKVPREEKEIDPK